VDALILSGYTGVFPFSKTKKKKTQEFLMEIVGGKVRIEQMRIEQSISAQQISKRIEQRIEKKIRKY